MLIAWHMPGSWQAECPTNEEHRVALQRVRAKKDVIAELIGGRLPLLEATARFQAQLAGESHNGEDLCRQVIGWVHLALLDCPEKAEAVSERLEQELHLHLARHGTVELACS